ncbi:MAG: DNA/RNA non-specific endonuclease [Solobacterium sp.]|nr:DNA/RNA non-specific endonuclease [Solobacterium sp.]
MSRKTAGCLTACLMMALYVFLLCGCFSKAVPSEPENSPAEVSSDFDLERFLSDLPAYEGEEAIVLNDGMPLFSEQEIETIREIHFSELDDLGQCGPATAYIGPETLASEERGSIGGIRPSGWHTVRYDDRIEDRYLYNRCHLIAYQLAGINDEERNLITGTRYLNLTGMLEYENAVLRYVTETGSHVLYRVTPVFEGDNLVSSGVLMEGYSLEDEGIRFFVYLFNVQPGIVIDYATGDSREDTAYVVTEEKTEAVPVLNQEIEVPERGAEETEITYVLNTNTKRFHDPSCPSVDEISLKNLAYSTETREALIAYGYQPCGRCKP